jgi:hypothetical protein
VFVGGEKRSIVDNRGIGISAPPRGCARRFFAGLGWWRWRGDGIVRCGEKDGRCSRTSVDGGFDGGELIAACPVLHERVKVGVTLAFDDCIAELLVGGLAALKLGDTEFGRRPVVIQVFTLYPR